MRKFVLGAGLVGSSCLVFALGALVRVPAAGKRVGNPSQDSAATRAAHATVSKTPSSPDVVARYGKLPLAFEPNMGQTSSEAKFLAHGDGYTLFLSPGESTVVLRSNSARTAQQSGIQNGQFSGRVPHTVPAVQTPAVLKMELAGASNTAYFTGLDELPGKSNYLIGKDPANWHTKIPNYRRVQERGVYRGVDLVYYGTQRQLEYDFLVAPGADPSVIELAFPSTKRLSIDNNGDLSITVAGKKAHL